jgi:3-oxoadipate enol-lactonase/4-carboxymuconolactone decarboxylase
MWEPQMPALSRWFRVIRYEHRGHGGTTPPFPGPYTIEQLGGDLLELLDHLGAPHASLCGLSLGGMVALWFASHHPGRVDRLVLACTAAELGPSTQWVERAATVRNADPQVLVGTLRERWFTPGFLDANHEVDRLVTSMLAAVDAEGYAGCCEAIAEVDLRSELGCVAAPTLVIAGSIDPVAPPARGLELQAGIHDASLVVLAGAAHLANLEQAGAFTDALIEHLAGRPAERGEATRRQVLGDEHVERSSVKSVPAEASFVDFITRTAWGEVWSRPGLDQRTRSCLTVALLAALGRPEELELHIAGARRNGVSDEEIFEIILHTSIYAGIPAANAALRIARKVLGAHG